MPIGPTCLSAASFLLLAMTIAAKTMEHDIDGAHQAQRGGRVRMHGNEDGWNRDVPSFVNNPRSDEEINQAVYDRLEDGPAKSEKWWQV